MIPKLRYLFAAVLIFVASGAAQQINQAELIDVRKIWDRAPHNAFTDLIRFKDQWYCAFREGNAHMSPDASLRILTSSDGLVWTPVALLSSTIADLREAKLAIMPDGRLMLTTAAAFNQSAGLRFHSFASFSADGKQWSEPVKIGEPDMWLWRVTWHDGIAYSIGYKTIAPNQFVRLYRSLDGVNFEPLVRDLFNRGRPSEGSIIFLEDGTALALLRQEMATAQLGSAGPPFQTWKWKEVGMYLGAPNLLRLSDGRIVAAGRLLDKDGNQRTSLLWLDPQAGKLTEFFTLPSGGDTSYPGLVFHDGLLWISYYSSHEGTASIYLATVKLPAITVR